MIKALLAGSALVAVAAVGAHRQQPRPTPAAARDTSTVVVWKSASCGCCAKWVDHMRAAGFRVEVHNTEDLAPVKRRNGVLTRLESCHTATVGGYVIEGHVPADLVARMLRERPAIAGLAAPGMPPSSPGMDMPGTPYEIIAFTRDSRTSVYARR